MKLSVAIESLLISVHGVKILQFFLYLFTWIRPSTAQKFKLRCSFTQVVSFHENLPYKNILFASGIYLFESSPQRKHKNKAWDHRGVFRTLSNLKMDPFAKTLNGFQLLTVVFITYAIYTERIQNPVEHLRWNFLRKDFLANS